VSKLFWWHEGAIPDASMRLFCGIFKADEPCAVLAISHSPTVDDHPGIEALNVAYNCTDANGSLEPVTPGPSTPHRMRADVIKQLPSCSNTTAISGSIEVLTRLLQLRCINSEQPNFGSLHSDGVAIMHSWHTNRFGRENHNDRQV
jgi:hypothetical protein